MIRQGDVMLVRCKAVPKGAKPVAPEGGRLVLAEGEATGHAHSVALSDRVAMFREDGSGGGLFLAVSGDAPVSLTHEEHTALSIAPGVHRVVRQRVWSAGMAQRVQD